MPRQTKEQKRIEREVEAAFSKHGSNAQFDIMDLSKISAAGRTAAAEGKDIEAAVVEAIAKYRKN